MTDFGGKLRQAREGRGISLRQIAANTKISVTALEALERNDISRLPGGIFSRSFVRSYAVEVGLDPDETVREFLDRFQAEPEEPAPAVEIPDEEIAFERRKQLAARIFVAATIVMIVVAAIIAYLTLRSRPPDAADAPPARGAAAVPFQPTPPGEAAMPGPPRTPPGGGVEPEPADAGGVPPIAVPPEDAALPGAERTVDPSADERARAAPDPAAPAPIQLEIHPTGACWVSVIVDGERALARMMAAGEREMLTVAESAVITVGDAAAFAFTIDGRPGLPLGGPGDVRTVRLSRETLSAYVR